MSDRNLSSKEVVVAVEHIMSKNKVAFLWGPPGIGKSDVVASIGKKQNRPVIDLRMLLLEPTDIKGIPYFDTNEQVMKWAAPSELPKGTEFDKNAILFLDELNAAPPSVQAAAYQLVLNRKVGEYVVPEGVSIIAAGNRENDRGVTYKMPSPLSNRLVHLEMEARFDDWFDWAVNSDVHADVVGFLSTHKQHLYNFDPRTSDKAFATPRSWSFVSDLMSDTLPTSMITSIVSGCVGEGVAIEFTQYRQITSKLPKPSDILSGKEKKLNVKEISAHYSLTISMCYELRDNRSLVTSDKLTNDEWHEQVENFFKFMLENFSTEMIIMGAKLALRDYKLPIDNKKVASFSTLCEKYGSYILQD